MLTNRQILENAFNTGNLVSFIRGGQKENNVKIVYLNSDDVCNKEFLFETSNGARYNSFEDSVIFVKTLKKNKTESIILECGENGTTLKIDFLKDGILLTELCNNKERVFLSFEQFEQIKVNLESL